MHTQEVAALEATLIEVNSRSSYTSYTTTSYKHECQERIQEVAALGAALQQLIHAHSSQIHTVCTNIQVMSSCVLMCTHVSPACHISCRAYNSWVRCCAWQAFPPYIAPHKHVYLYMTDTALTTALYTLVGCEC